MCTHFVCLKSTLVKYITKRFLTEREILLANRK